MTLRSSFWTSGSQTFSDRRPLVSWATSLALSLPLSYFFFANFVLLSPALPLPPPPSPSIFPTFSCGRGCTAHFGNHCSKGRMPKMPWSPPPPSFPQTSGNHFIIFQCVYSLLNSRVCVQCLHSLQLCAFMHVRICIRLQQVLWIQLNEFEYRRPCTKCNNDGLKGD